MKVKEITHVKIAMPWPYIVLMGVMKNSLKRFAKFLFNDVTTEKSRYYFLLALTLTWEMGAVDMYILRESRFICKLSSILSAEAIKDKSFSEVNFDKQLV